MTASSSYPLFFIPLTLFPENPARSARGFFEEEESIYPKSGIGFSHERTQRTQREYLPIILRFQLAPHYPRPSGETADPGGVGGKSWQAMLELAQHGVHGKGLWNSASRK